MEIIAAYGTAFVILAIIFGLYMTWGIGANDLANAMGTSVGAGAVTIRQAIAIAIIFEFSGAVLAGGHVTSTIRKGIIDPSSIVNSPEILVYGMLASLLAAAFWLMVASWKGWPVSTTHSIIGALIGFAIVGIGPDAVIWSKVGSVVGSWVVSPVVGGTISFLLVMSTRKLIFDTDMGGDVNSFRQNLQSEYVTRLVAVIAPAFTQARAVLAVAAPTSSWPWT